MLVAQTPEDCVFLGARCTERRCRVTAPRTKRRFIADAQPENISLVGQRVRSRASLSSPVVEGRTSSFAAHDGEGWLLLAARLSTPTVEFCGPLSSPSAEGPAPGCTDCGPLEAPFTEGGALILGNTKNGVIFRSASGPDSKKTTNTYRNMSNVKNEVGNWTELPQASQSFDSDLCALWPETGQVSWCGVGQLFSPPPFPSARTALTASSLRGPQNCGQNESRVRYNILSENISGRELKKTEAQAA